MHSCILHTRQICTLAFCIPGKYALVQILILSLDTCFILQANAHNCIPLYKANPFKFFFAFFSNLCFKLCSNLPFPASLLFSVPVFSNHHPFLLSSHLPFPHSHSTFPSILPSHLPLPSSLSPLTSLFSSPALSVFPFCFSFLSHLPLCLPFLILILR